MRAWFLLSIASCLSAADLGGLGEDPVPGGTAPFWLYWQNDGFGPSFGRNSDDYRSNALGFGIRDEDWVFGADFSLMTDTNPTRAKPAWGTPDPFIPQRVGQHRVDELTSTLAWRTGSDGWELRIGPGVRATGDLGGQSLQERTHLILGQQVVDLPYERHSLAWDGLGYARAGGPIPLVGPLSLDVRTLGLATTGGEQQAQVSAELIASGPEAAVWIGAEHQFRAGDNRTATQASIASEEEGNWIGAGFSASLPPIRLSFSAARQWTNNDQMGVLTIASDPAHPVNPTGLRTTAEFGVVPRLSSGDGRGQQYRLLVAPRGFPAGVSVFADVQDIASEPPYHHDLEGRRQQVAGGARWELPASGRGFHPVAGVDAAVGLCQARIVDFGWTTIGGETKVIDNTACLHGGPFTGLGWSGPNHSSLALIAAADGFLPFHSRTVSLDTLNPGTDTVVNSVSYDLLRPDVGYVLRFQAGIAW